VGLTGKQVQRIRYQFVHQGLESTLTRKPRRDAGTPKKADGHFQAQLTTLACSTPPAGRQRWTIRLLADELGRLKIVTAVSPETVRRCLKKIG
jgi:hypothetical protein